MIGAINNYSQRSSYMHTRAKNQIVLYCHFSSRKRNELASRRVQTKSSCNVDSTYPRTSEDMDGTLNFANNMMWFKFGLRPLILFAGDSE